MAVSDRPVRVESEGFVQDGFQDCSSSSSYAGEGCGDVFRPLNMRMASWIFCTAPRKISMHAHTPKNSMAEAIKIQKYRFRRRSHPIVFIGKIAPPSQVGSRTPLIIG